MAVETRNAVERNTHGKHSPSIAYVNRRLLGGSAVLMAGGLLAWVAGATVGLSATVGACRRYVADLQEPPVETARRRWEQAKTATAAGYGAWHDFARQRN